MKYFSITKPGIIFGNGITFLGGYFLASHGHIHFWHMLFAFIGMGLVIASGCVFNNIIDSDIDQLMERTKKRVLACGLISKNIAAIYAALLGSAGFLLLYFKINQLSVIISAIGLFFYVAVYTLYMKRRSVYGVIVGGIAGAVPPVVGYCAVSNRLDITAVLLFLILFFWQIPHFYAIAIFRLKDYAAASIPVLPLKKSMQHTKIRMFLYILAFTIVAILPTFFGGASFIYFSVALGLGLLWLFLGAQGFITNNDVVWSRKMFFFSIFNITLLSMLMAV